MDIGRLNDLDYVVAFLDPDEGWKASARFYSEDAALRYGQKLRKDIRLTVQAVQMSTSTVVGWWGA